MREVDVISMLEKVNGHHKLQLPGEKEPHSYKDFVLGAIFVLSCVIVFLALF